jgi:hypothetical protein
MGNVGLNQVFFRRRLKMVFKRSVLLVCTIATLGIVAVPAALAEAIVIAPSQSCRTDVLNPDSNRHDASKLSVRSDASSAKSWIKFDLGGLDVGSLETATLAVALHEPKTGARNFDVSYVNDDCLDNIEWDERSITWNNAPGNSPANFGGLDAGKTTVVTTVRFTDGVAGDAFTIDILDVLQTDTDGIVQFVLHNSNGLLNFATHDHAEEGWRPFISVTEGTKAKAKKPYPAKGATDVPRDVVLTWVPGAYAPAVNGHNVYFSDSLDDVNDGVALVSPSQDANSYDPGLLEFGATYYWRVDEANGVSGWESGDIWSFTVEPYSYKVPSIGITATASSSFNAESGPQKTVNASGLDASDQHDTTPANMWASAIGQEPPIWIQYDFDTVYKLHEMWVWNSNNTLEPLVGVGVKTATIEYSTDGVTWTALADVPEFAQAPGVAGYAYDTTVDFNGAVAKSVRMTFTDNWGEAEQYGLSEVRFFYIPVLPREPRPGIGAADVPLDTTLRWRAGREAALHRVHFGVDSSAVAEGAALVDTVATAAYTVGALSLGTTYYWKIDEVNDAATPNAWEGPVWNFTTKPYIVVEDFEVYTDEVGAEIFATWVDGYDDPANGSQVGHDLPPYAERVVRHGGSQSMLLKYGENGATNSEATRTFTPAEDWTHSGIDTLTLYFYGQTTNTTTVPLWVKLTDSNGKSSAKVTFGSADGEDVAALGTASWTAWNIPMSGFSGVTLSKVKSMTIGLGAGAGAGMLYIDDIQLGVAK